MWFSVCSFAAASERRWSYDSRQGVAMDDPPDSRLFVVCGKAAEVRWRTHLRSLHTGVHAALARLHAWRRAQVELLQEAFARFGNVQNVKVVRDKGGAHSCRAPGVLLCADACTQRRVAPRCAASAHAHAAFRQLQPAERAHVRAVAYVKYDKASSAAAAIESMHEAVLNDGRGPMLKVLLAEAPNVRCRQGRLSSVTGSWAP